MEQKGTGQVLSRQEWIRYVAAIGGRYSIATLGPLSVSVAHFLASLILLRLLTPAEFGLFAFLLVIVGFGTSLSNALIATPYTVVANQPGFDRKTARVFFKVNLLFAVLIGLVCGGIAFGMSAGNAAPLIGLYGGFAMLRWFARAHSYAMHAPVRVSVVDIVYACLLLSGLAIGQFTHHMSLDVALTAFVSAAVAAVLVSGKDYLKLQFVEAFAGRLHRYGPIWQSQSRWTLLGVVSTEATLNAHAYLVTLIAGPAAFAPLAAAALFMRPVTMSYNSMVQLERPIMARAIASGDYDKVLRQARHFRWAIFLVWLVTIGLAAAVFLWFPELILSRHYDLYTVMAATALWAAIEGIESQLMADSAVLQAANRFQPLAGASFRSSFATIISATVLLIAFGPLASLGGVLVGAIVLAHRMAVLRKMWRLGE